MCNEHSRCVVSLLDYGAGNVRSIRNAIKSLGHEIRDIKEPGDLLSDETKAVVFPGVGSFGSAMSTLNKLGYTGPLKEYISNNRPFFGICLGLQTLFESSDECPEIPGLGLIPGIVTEIDRTHLAVPHIGWNGLSQHKESAVLSHVAADDSLYFVHSFRALPTPANKDWVLCTTTYGEPGAEDFISAIQKGNTFACQFHPEKSGRVGMALLKSWLGNISSPPQPERIIDVSSYLEKKTIFCKRVIACLDVRTDDHGNLVVTKGDQYDVRHSVPESLMPEGDSEKDKDDRSGKVRRVRNLGKPVDLSARYYSEGADEIVFLNITSFRQGVMEDIPMLRVLELASERIFVPLTVGGGIRAYMDSNGIKHSAVDVAAQYFCAGADKVSIGSDAVYAALEYIQTGKKTGETSIEQISHRYGRQAVVVSVDPRRVYVTSPNAPEAGGHECLDMPHAPGPNAEKHAWYQCTVKGGREGSDLDALQMVRACEELGAGEILLNCINTDGQKNGFDLVLAKAITSAIRIPVIASSGAGSVDHFSEVFRETGCPAALGAGIFHHKLVGIDEVKNHLIEQNIPTRKIPKDQ